ncbi:hypothetical protein [Chitinibacter tainanensis]|uniref:hypothetical protein n=1 Tax=Chitinibacter tainanensis TaxID=230667 RepID=UPI0004121A0D|nr:hypothetical protein [Chitinibacter tainanensis]
MTKRFTSYDIRRCVELLDENQEPFVEPLALYADDKTVLADPHLLDGYLSTFWTLYGVDEEGIAQAFFDGTEDDVRDLYQMITGIDLNDHYHKGYDLNGLPAVLPEDSCEQRVTFAAVVTVKSTP